MRAREIVTSIACERRGSRWLCALGRSATMALCASALLGLGWSLFLKPDPDVAKGNSLVEAGKAEDALKAYTRAEQRLGRRAQLDFNRGLALFGMGKYDEARDAFLAASGATDESLRRGALYNLANTLYKQAEPALETADKATKTAQEAETQLAAMGPNVDQQARCMAMQKVLEALKQAGEAQRASGKAFQAARKEYRRVLEASPSFFDAKWNLELTLRHQGTASHAAAQLAEREKALAERHQRECKPEDQKDKQDQKDQKDKQDQDDQKEQKDKQDQDDQKEQKDKQDQDDQKDQKDKQDQDDQKDQKDKQDRQDQKPMTKEEIARDQAERELEKLERKQRERDQQRARSGTSQQPAKDW